MRPLSLCWLSLSLFQLGVAILGVGAELLLNADKLVYLAMRSVRLIEPVLIWPEFVATAMSAMVVSSVSPERCDVTVV